MRGEDRLCDVGLGAAQRPERRGVVVGDRLVEAPREAAEDTRVADVRPREAAADHAADVRAALHERHAGTGVACGGGSRDTRGGRAVDADVAHTNGASSAFAVLASMPSASRSTSDAMSAAGSTVASSSPSAATTSAPYRSSARSNAATGS